MEGSLVSGWGGVWYTPIGQAVLRLKLRFFSDAGSAVQDIGAVRQTLSREQRNAQATRLLTEYGGSILRLAYSYLHERSDAEDIVQDTLIRFLKTAPVLENPAHEKAWLLRVAANLCKNRIEYNRVRTADELSEELVAEEREDLSEVWQAVGGLPEKYRAVIHLFHYEGYSTAQIAKILDRKEATIRSDLRRGRQKLKEILKEAYDFGEV